MYGNLNTPNVCVVAGSSKARLGAAIMGLKCEENGQGHSPLNVLLLQVKLRLFRKREPL